MKGTKTGGRRVGALNKVTADVRVAAQDYGSEALDALVEVMRSNESPPAARIAAAREVLDRAYGKPGQSANPADADDQIPILIDPDPDV